MKRMTKKKYLIDSSVVPAALACSTPEHNAYVAEQVQGGALWTSLYLRMEFIRRRFCDSVRMALTISQCSSVAAALRLLEQDFKGRNLKGFIACIAEHLEHSGSMANTRAAAEELGSQALRWLKK